MKTNLSIFILLLTINSSFAVANTAQIPALPTPSASAINDAKINPKDLPSLGTCDPYTDYFIYKCKPFKCRLPVGAIPGITREMETIGYEKDLCVHNYKFIIRNSHFPPSDLKMSCHLSEKGRLEMSHLFTQYKKGKTDVYANPQFNEILSKECNAY